MIFSLPLNKLLISPEKNIADIIGDNKYSHMIK